VASETIAAADAGNDYVKLVALVSGVRNLSPAMMITLRKSTQPTTR